MIEIKVNFNDIEARVAAARALQEGGEKEASKEVLIKLGNDIVTKLST